MRIGLWGARADAGGLAAMSYEFARHMRPERTMIIDLGERGRGPAHPERFADGDVWVNQGMNDDIPADTVRRFCDGLDVIYACETLYRDDVLELAHETGCRVVLHAMPELYRHDLPTPDEVWLPTGWEAERIPAARIVPVPVPTDVFAPDPNLTRAQAQRGVLFHMSAPAFHDRNGTELVLAALRELGVPARVVFAGPQAPPMPSARNRRGLRIDVGWRPGASYDRRDAYPDDCGALLLPRRYAGLSLPMQEAAGLGWPIISLDLAPQNEWLHPALLVPAEEQYAVRMVGGAFPVYGCRPYHLARCIARLINEPDVWAEARQRSLDRAAELSWERWAPEYRRLLEEATAR